jgi:Hsp20/alpha crystallin family
LGRRPAGWYLVDFARSRHTTPARIPVGVSADWYYYLTERSYGQFRRSFYVPDGVDRDKIEAAFANGVLNVTMPKSGQAAAKKIEVKTAA